MVLCSEGVVEINYTGSDRVPRRTGNEPTTERLGTRLTTGS